MNKVKVKTVWNATARSLTGLLQVVVKPISRCVRSGSTDLQQLVPASLIQAVCNNLLRDCCYQLVNKVLQTDYIRFFNLEQVVASEQVCLLYQPWYKMITTCSRQQLATGIWDFCQCKDKPLIWLNAEITVHARDVKWRDTLEDLPTGVEKRLMWNKIFTSSLLLEGSPVRSIHVVYCVGFLSLSLLN
jgi:hypothetical protein